MDSMVYFSSLLPIQMLNAKEPVAIIIAYIYIYYIVPKNDTSSFLNPHGFSKG